jgi:putative ABC transport system ATP-binding protein
VARSALDRVCVGPVADTFAERLSVGEQQRVAIARAITGDRPILLADEPSAALDRTSADEVSALLADLAHEGRAVLLVTHDAQLASWADRTLVLRDGCTVDEIAANPGPAR